MLPNNFTNNNFITKQLKLLLEIEKIIDISDPVYTFCDVIDHIDLKSYFAEEGCKTGRPRCDSEKLLKVILFAFMQNGISSLKELEGLCKTDHYATFMRVKRDYMGNDQILPAYNVQAAICDEYIAVIDTKKYASDMECFVPLMEKFNDTYGHYPKYPVADAGYGSYNNYIYCEEHSMEKFMKFTMFEKETKDKKYRDNPYRAINFSRDEEGNLICPNGKKFIFKYEKKVRKNKYGRTEEFYECENCEGCPYWSECCKRTTKNRTISLNRELTSMHEEVIDNLESVHGELLCMNRSIQAEGTFGIIKWNRSYKRLFRGGLDNVIFELTLISCGYNLYKYNNKVKRQMLAA